MGIGQVLTMPLFFASNAIYPLAMMLHWLQRVARDFAVVIGTLAVLVATAARLYPTLVR